jgi:hypothetical protein
MGGKRTNNRGRPRRDGVKNVLSLGRTTLKALLVSLVAATIVVALYIGATNRDIRILGRWRVEKKAHPDLYWLVLTASLVVALTVLAAGWKLELSDAVFGRPSLAQEHGR